MKLTNVLFAHHKRRWLQRQWRAKGWQVKRHSYAKQVLEENNIPYENAIEFVKEPEVKVIYNYDRVFQPPALPKDIHHPEFKSTPCLQFDDTNVLVEGLEQAKVLTNTVEIEDGLPQQILKLKEKFAQPKEVHKIVEKNLLSALVYDCTQDLLPRRKDPERPTFVFPRDYGLVDTRKNFTVCNKLVQLVENFSQSDISSKAIIDNAQFQISIEKDKDLLQFNLRGDKVITSTQPLQAFVKPEEAESIELPNLYPLTCTISIKKNHFYNIFDLFPITEGASYPYLHTVLVHFNESEVKNAYATQVTESQFYCRSLMKAFTVAATQARYLYGSDVQDLPSPYTIQLIQTDTKVFHFSTFQLNTLDLSSNQKTKNIFWSHPLIQLSVDYGYSGGMPFFTGYNPHVFDLINAFYHNGSQRRIEASKAAVEN